MLGILRKPQLERAETTDDGVFQYLLGHGAEGVVRVRLLKSLGQDADALRPLRKFVEVAPATRLHPPVHAGDTVLDGVDGLARDRRLRKSTQIGGCGFWQGLIAKATADECLRQRGGFSLVSRSSFAAEDGSEFLGVYP